VQSGKTEGAAHGGFLHRLAHQGTRRRARRRGMERERVTLA
jgi:hypothetical protein